jgi:hypothetical protein
MMVVDAMGECRSTTQEKRQASVRHQASHAQGKRNTIRSTSLNGTLQPLQSHFYWNYDHAALPNSFLDNIVQQSKRILVLPSCITKHFTASPKVVHCGVSLGLM